MFATVLWYTALVLLVGGLVALVVWLVIRMHRGRVNRSCELTSDCTVGQACINSTCLAPDLGSCQADDQCFPGSFCVTGVCRFPGKRARSPDHAWSDNEGDDTPDEPNEQDVAHGEPQVCESPQTPSALSPTAIHPRVRERIEAAELYHLKHDGIAEQRAKNAAITAESRSVAAHASRVSAVRVPTSGEKKRLALESPVSDVRTAAATLQRAIRNTAGIALASVPPLRAGGGAPADPLDALYASVKPALRAPSSADFYGALVVEQGRDPKPIIAADVAAIVGDVRDMTQVGPSALMLLRERDGGLVLHTGSNITQVPSDTPVDHIIMFGGQLLGRSNGVLYRMKNFPTDTSNLQQHMPPRAEWEEISGIPSREIIHWSRKGQSELSVQDLTHSYVLNRKLAVVEDKPQTLLRTYGDADNEYIDIDDDTHEATTADGETFQGVHRAVYLAGKVVALTTDEYQKGWRSVHSEEGRLLYIAKRSK